MISLVLSLISAGLIDNLFSINTTTVHIYISILLLLFANSCQAQANFTEAPKSKAMILQGVPMAADGCGNLVQIDSSTFHAKNLPVEFVKDSLWVDITYKLTDTIYCGRGRYPMPAIEILKIKMAK